MEIHHTIKTKTFQADVYFISLTDKILHCETFEFVAKTAPSGLVPLKTSAGGQQNTKCNNFWKYQQPECQAGSKKEGYLSLMMWSNL